MKKYDLPYPKFENDNLNYYVTISDYEGKEFNIKENNLYNALSEVINYSLYFSFNIGKKHCHEHEFDYVIKNLYLYPESFNLNDLDKTFVVYEYIDDLNPHLAGTDELPVNVREKYEKTMKEKDSIVVVTADALQRDVLSKRGDSHLVFSCNGVDYNHFHNEIDPDFKFEKEFAEILEKGQPMIGYYGALAKWFDYQLVKELAETGKYQIVLFGIKYDDSYEKAGLDRQENVHFLGSRDYHVLQNYAAKMDVLTIPFLINEITKATSPVKLFEYMALNKPIVTTDMDECRKYQSVLIGHDHKEFEAKLDEALGKRSDKAYIELLDREALENTWEEKAKAIIEEMKHCEEADGNR